MDARTYEAWAIVGQDGTLPSNAAALYGGETMATIDAQSTDRVVKVRVTIEDATATQRAADAERERDEAVAMVRKHEWSGPRIRGGQAVGQPTCLECGHRKKQGHSPTCALARLAQPKETTP